MTTHTTIKWTKNFSGSYRTQKFGNLLSDTYQGSVDPTVTGKWCGWFMDLSNSQYSKFRLNFASKGAAVCWVNRLLRERGIK